MNKRKRLLSKWTFDVVINKLNAPFLSKMPDEEDKLDKSKIIDKVYFVYD